ncbi:MAG: ABC transporter ATP-binding protein [Methanosarcinales archaeon]|nr:ABC transporter ATP-binding protein [Methanosarcinales archaeon]
MLEVENLSKAYSLKGVTVPALKGVSFRAREGEILGIVGRSGGGKSTLMKILRGMETFDSGSIRIDELVITPDSDPKTTRRQQKITAIHLQREFGLWTESALKNVVRRVNSQYAGYEVLPTEEDPMYDQIYVEAWECLRLVGLEKKALHLATILSGGEKQRLLIARQLAKKPKILLLDEPATMACPTTKQEVLDTVKKVNRELNLTTIVVSHLPEVHQYLADRLIWLDEGEIKQEGKPREILESFLSLIGKPVPLPPRPQPEPIIHVSGLYKRNYLVGPGEVLKMENLNLDINRGETTAIIGPSGAGKTTLLMMIEGLRKPDDGSILYRIDGDWINILEYSPARMEVRRNLGIMYQEFALMSGETVVQQIGYQLGVKGQNVIEQAKDTAEELGISHRILDALYTLTDMREDEARAYLEQLGLTRDILTKLFPRFPDTETRNFAEPIFKLMHLDMAVLDKLPAQLSGGESVRVSLAILLAAKPRILILDEPFGDIDPITLREVANGLKSIQSEFGTTILLVSHHVDFVKEVAHRAVLIEGGAVALDGKPDEVCNAFLSRCGAAYLKHIQSAEAQGDVAPATQQ